MKYVYEQVINALREIKYNQVVSKYATVAECKETRNAIDEIILFVEHKFKELDSKLKELDNQ